ncbi:restriction endonuclease [Niallia circulans]|uniref:restriction endonuclease n=1 Tax=Niallia circulans TaxID=1397 RepID=UPI003524B54D
MSLVTFVLENYFGIFILMAFFYSLYIIYSYKEQKKYEERLSQANINEIDSMSGIEFEEYLEVLFKKLGYKVKRTKASNDYGADLILNGESRIAIQAKRYNKTVGVKAIQEVNSARQYYNTTYAWVITNNYFSSNAINLANVTNVKLVDRDELVDLILSTKRTTRANYS